MAEQHTDKEFVPGMFGRTQNFSNGHITKVSVKCDEFKEWAEAHVTDTGWLNIDLKQTKSDPEKLYAEKNTWVPKNQGGGESDDGLPY